MLTLNLSESESRNWRPCAATRAYLRTYAARQAQRTGRRFAQIKSASGQLLAVLEVEL